MAKTTTVVLIKETDLDYHQLNEYYFKPLIELGFKREELAAIRLLYDNPKKVSAKVGKAWLDKLLDTLPKTTKRLVVADGEYYKWLTKSGKVSTNIGVPVLGKYPGYEELRIVYVPNYKGLFKNPESANLITIGLNALSGIVQKALIESAEYITKLEDDQNALDHLYQYPALTVDIETTGLTLNDSIVTIAFAWNKHNGIAIDLRDTGYWSTKQFLERYTGKLIMHNALFDAKLLISNWWMEHETDYEGMQRGLDVFAKVDDTMLLAYLAKNATTSVELGLKANAIEFVGNYALDVTDVSKHSQTDLLKYNLVDTLATWFVYEKFHSQLTSEPYTAIFQPSIKPILKMMLVGLPLDQEVVDNAYQSLQEEENQTRNDLAELDVVKSANIIFQQQAMEAANAKLKTKVKTIDEFSDVEFNPSSGKQIAEVLFQQLQLPVLDKTAGGQPATDAKTLKKLREQTEDVDALRVIDGVLKIAEVSKITGTFLKAFKAADNFLHGHLKLGGTQSGRLSSNSPNLTNLPAQGKMGKLIKSCFVAPKGWLFAGADFNALEARINAIVSGDPNRIKIYTEGYDSHSLNAYSYFSEQMPDINPDDPDSINSISSKYPKLRQKSKGPTFALTYGGTAFTLHKNAGIPLNEAKQIEASYHDLYRVSDEFAEKNKQFAIQHGYMQCAFGLQIKTPIISKSIMDHKKTPYDAIAEVRSANNAVTQSWGMLLNRAVIATNRRIEDAGMYADILPINMIHDAAYFLVKDDPQAIKFLNDVLIEEMEWNDHPVIQSDDIPMLSDLEIGKSWATLTEVPNKASIDDIKSILEKL